MNGLTRLAIILVFICFLSGGVGTLTIYLFGAQTIMAYRFASVAPFFGGFLLMGFFGLFYTWKHAASRQCLYGLLVAVVSYGCIELIFKMVKG